MKKTNFCLVFLFFLLVGCLYTFPLVLHISTSYYGAPGESGGLVWQNWWFNFASTHHLNYQNFSHLAAPFGQSLEQIPSQPLWDFGQRILSGILGPVAAYNAWILAGYVLSGYFMFLLVAELTGNFWASLLSGFIYCLTPFRTFHYLQVASLGDIQWIPLYFYGLLKTIKNPRPGWIAGTAGFLTILVLSGFYYGFFTLWLTLFFCLLLMFFSGRLKNINPALGFNRSKILALALVLGLSVILIYWLRPPFVRALTGGSKDQAVLAVNYASRFYADLERYSARPLEYLVPPIDHPLWGRAAREFMKDRLHGSNFFEQTLFLGYIPLLLALAGFFILLKEKKDSQLKIFFWIFLGSLFFSIYCSLAPRPHWLGLNFWAPSFFLYRIFPMFRVYSRCAVLVIFCLAVLAGLSWQLISEKIRKKKPALILVLILMAGVAVEFFNFPPAKMVGLAPSAAARWLAAQPGDFIVAEYPLVSWLEPVFGHYLLDQRIHQKRLFNGAMSGTYADQLRGQVIDLNAPDAASLLARLGVKYVIINKNIFREGRILKPAQKYFEKEYSKSFPAEWHNGVPFDLFKNSGYRRAVFYGDQDIYEVIARPAEKQMVWKENFWPPERWEDNRFWRWMYQNGELEITNFTTREKEISFSLLGQSFFHARKLSVSRDGKILKTWELPAGKIIELGRLILRVPPGRTVINFQASPGPDNIHKTIGNLDGRDVSVALSIK